MRGLPLRHCSFHRREFISSGDEISVSDPVLATAAISVIVLFSD